MRPYYAIIKDSFREALASRVLWVLLGLITLQLCLLAPLGVQQNLTTEFSPGDIHDGPGLIGKLRRASLAPEPSPGKRLWSLLDEGTKARLLALEQVQPDEGRDFFRGMEALRGWLNNLVHRRDLADDASWDPAALPQEARDYLERERKALREDELARMNRLLIEAAAPGNFRRRSPHSMSITYFFAAMDLSGPLPFSQAQVDTFVKEWVVSSLMSVVVGVAGIIAAILVTSTIIPHMFEPGSINLLLSKPVSRSLLFLSKFFGACAFILLNVGYLIVGLWLILGARFGIWNQGILWCIPVFLFLFLIYYSVSALTGLLWKSAVISVVATVVFWASCFSIGTTKSIMEALLLDQRRLTRLTEVDGELLAITEQGALNVWDGNGWRQVYEPTPGGGAPTIDGPVYHAPTEQILLGQGFRNPFGFVGQRISLRVGRADEGWQIRDGPALPGGTATFVMFADGTVLAVATDNVFALRGHPLPAGSGFKLFGVPLPLGGPRFDAVLQRLDRPFMDPMAAAADPAAPRLVICSGNNVTLIERDERGGYAAIAETTLPGDEKQGSAVALAGEVALVAREDGKLYLLRTNDLSIRQETTLESRTQPRFAGVSSDGKLFAVLFQNRRLWLIDAATGKARLAPVSGQGDISGFVFSGQSLLVADRVQRVTAYDPKNFDRQWARRPSMSRVELMYYFSILPLYTVFPKPGELDNTVHYLLTGKRTTDAGLFRGDVTQQRADLHPWRPVRSGLAFVAVMLLISCLYLERHEF